MWRTKQPRKVAAASAAVSLLLALAACSSDSDSDSDANGGPSTQDRVQIAMFGFAAANAYTQYAKQGAEAAAAKENIDLTFFDGKFDPAVQFNQVQDAVASGNYDGFFILANDGNSLLPAVQEAIDRGIKVTAGQYALGPDFETLEPQIEGLTSTIGYTLTDEAKGSAELMQQACAAKVGDGEACQVAVMMGDRKLPFDAFKLNFVHEFMDDNHPEIEVIDAPDGGYTRDGGLTAASDLLQSHPDVDVIAAIASDAMALGAEQAVKSAGKTPGTDVMLIGLGASQSGIQAIRKGSWYGDVVTQPYTIGELGVTLAAQAARGEEVDQVVDMYGYAPVGATVTKESLDANPDFTGEWEG